MDKASYYSWHDLVKNPEDIPPKDDKFYLLRLNTDEPVVKNVIWRGDMIRPNVDEDIHILAWKEIEPFEEYDER